MSNNPNIKKSDEDDDYIRGMTSFTKPKNVEPLRSRAKSDNDEELLNTIEKLPEGYGAPKPERRSKKIATETLRARISAKTHEEIVAHKEGNIGLTYVAIVEEMWSLYKEKHGL